MTGHAADEVLKSAPSSAPPADTPPDTFIAVCDLKILEVYDAIWMSHAKELAETGLPIRERSIPIAAGSLAPAHASTQVGSYARRLPVDPQNIAAELVAEAA